MKRLLTLIVLGLFVFSVTAFAYAAGPSVIKGNLGTAVQVAQMKARENLYREQCYFTSQGAVCPTLTPARDAVLKRQDTRVAIDLPKRSDTQDEREVKIQLNTPATGISRVKNVMSISGKPGAFSRWAKSKRNVRNLCYFGASDSGNLGNLICPTHVTDYGVRPLSFRPHIARKPTLESVGKEELGVEDMDRRETSHSLPGYKLI